MCVFYNRIIKLDKHKIHKDRKNRGERDAIERRNDSRFDDPWIQWSKDSIIREFNDPRIHRSEFRKFKDRWAFLFLYLIKYDMLFLFLTINVERARVHTYLKKGYLHALFLFNIFCFISHLMNCLPASSPFLSRYEIHRGLYGESVCVSISLIL